MVMERVCLLGMDIFFFVVVLVLQSAKVVSAREFRRRRDSTPLRLDASDAHQ